MSDVVVIGGGVIGLSSALALAGRGLDVAVVDRDAPGKGATWAAGGMLAPLAEAQQPGPFLELALASARRYSAFAAAVTEASGLDVEYLPGGKLHVALGDAAAERLRARHAWLNDHGVDLLDAGEARRLEPELSPDARAALLIREEHRVDNRRLGRALWLACVRAGVRFHIGAGAEAVVSTADGSRITGVALDTGETVPASWVVVAAGAWSSAVRGLPRPLPVRPVRGQMVALDAGPLASTRVLLSERCYLVPRTDGRLIIGSTMETAGFRATATAGGVGGLLTAAVELVPALADAPVAEIWAGLRPGTPDGLPVLGPDPDTKGLVYATGHLRNGILLAPVTADIVASVVLGEAAPLDIAAFSPSRFDGIAAR